MSDAGGRPDFRAIDIAIISVPERLRPVDTDRVGLIAESMAQIGQESAITVNCPDQMKVPDFPDAVELVTGAHRLAAALQLGQTTINARLIAVDRNTARLIEIDENLTRVELSALDRCLFLAERKRVWEALHPGTKRGGNRRKDQTAQDSVCGFARTAAEAAGVSERKIYKELAVAAGLSPEVIAALRGTYLTGHASDLQKLARLAPELQAAAIAKISAGKARTVREAIGGPAKVGATADQAAFEALLKIWNRAGAKARNRFLAEIGAELTGGE